MPIQRSLLIGLGLWLGLVAPGVRLAGAQPPDPVAQAEPSEAAASDAAAAEEAAEPEAPAETGASTSPPRPPGSGIEEIIVRGSESDAAKDFETADSVTGFGAEDLAALGAQSIADLAEFTPNLEIVTSGATTPTFFTGTGDSSIGRCAMRRIVRVSP